MGRAEHKNLFIEDRTKCKKAYMPRLMTMMRKRYELETMCGAKIEIKIIHGEQSVPNKNPCKSPDELEDDEDEVPVTSNGMHVAAWYKDNKPKTTKNYYREKQQKMRKAAGLQYVETNQERYSQMVFSPKKQTRSLFDFQEQERNQFAPMIAQAKSVRETIMSAPSVQDPMQFLTSDAAFSSLFACPVVHPIQAPDDEFFGNQYKITSPATGGETLQNLNVDLFLEKNIRPCLLQPPRALTQICLF